MKKINSKAIIAVIIVAMTATYIIRLCALSVKLDQAKAVIEQVREDNPNYFYDVLVEGDAYQDYIVGK